MKIELKATFDSRKQFYKKAMVENAKNIKKLYSYDTLVAEIKGKKAMVYNVESQTTIRHIREFLLQNNFKAETKKQIIKDYLK